MASTDSNKTTSENNAKPSAFSGFLRYFYGNFVVLILGFVSIPLITRVMSREEYGRTGMFTSAVTVIYIFAILGMDQAYIRYYYKENINRRVLFKKCITPAILIVGFLCLLYVILSKPSNTFLFGQQGLDLTLLVVAYTIISVFERFLFLDIRMSQNGKLYSNLNILSKLLYIILVVVFALTMGDNFRVVMWAMTLSLGVITLFIGVRYLVRGENVTEVSREEYPLTQAELLKYGIPFILVLLMEWLLSSCDKWALRVYSGYGELGIYNSAMNIMSILLTFKATFIAFWSPVAMEKYEKDTYENCVLFFKEAFKVTRFLCILAGAGLVLFKDVIVFILGENYRTASGIIPFLTLMPVFSILFEITIQGIKFQKKNRYLNYASVVAIVFNIGGNCILVPYLGGVGAALATGVTYMAYFAIGSFFAEKCYKVGYDNLRTVIYAVLLFGYACIAVFFNVTAGIVTGVLFITVLLIMERRVIKLCLEYIVGIIKRRG